MVLTNFLGETKPLDWSQQGADTKVTASWTLPGQYAYVLKIAGPLSSALQVIQRIQKRGRGSLFPSSAMKVRL